MRDLKDLRKEIDAVDKQIVELFQKRMGIAEKVAEYKISTGKKVFDKEREIEKLKSLTVLGDNEFNRIGIGELFEQIMAVSRKRQYQMLTEHGIYEKPDFVQIEALDYHNAKIVFQGTEGAYSQLALKEYFGHETDSFHVETWRDAMEAIRKGEADYAVLPIENSSAGIVSENYDLLIEYDNCIVGEQIIPIEHALLGLPEAELSDITEVYSHPQALMQCGRYLENHREWEKHSLKNTAVSACKVKEDAKKNQAAILHDCGKYISFANGPQCSYDIIMASEIIGLTHLEREIVAETVLYNTRPLGDYDEVSDKLDKNSYLTVAKLSAILRVSNAMDRSHKQKFKNVKAAVKGKELVITVETEDDIALEKALFEAKTLYFEHIFSIKPVLKEKRVYNS